MVNWLPALFTGLGAALVGGIFNEVKSLQKAIMKLTERIARIEGKMEK
jgi:hypothetical protein